jgi:hypothetical protein
MARPAKAAATVLPFRIVAGRKPESPEQRSAAAVAELLLTLYALSPYAGAVLTKQFGDILSRVIDATRARSAGAS